MGSHVAVRPRGTRALLEHFQVDMNKANQLLRSFAHLNWTTLLVALCEIRQARGTTIEENAEFDRIVFAVRACPPAQRIAIGSAVAKVVAEGPQSHCYCVRLFNILRAWFPTVDVEQNKGYVDQMLNEEAQHMQVDLSAVLL